MLALAAASRTQSLEEQVEAIPNEVSGVEAETPSQAGGEDLEQLLLDVDSSYAAAFDMAPKVPAHSICIPATARNALSVGAVDARTDRIEDYSSRGPTDDGRMKPDVSAPDNTVSVAYGRGGSPGRLPGTSAAAPHVAGFAALLKQQNPSASPAALHAAVRSQVRPRGRQAPNADYGHGQ